MTHAEVGKKYARELPTSAVRRWKGILELYKRNTKYTWYIFINFYVFYISINLP